MSDDLEIWKPGSFTKNFSWGKGVGLKRLHEAIRIGFDGQVADVQRDLFISRIETLGRPTYIPTNFFLFNKIIDGVSYIVADELVFQALNYPHSSAFDKLAIFAFNLSYAGIWIGARPEQRRPALWAFHYIRDRVARQQKWNSTIINAADIENFVINDPHYKAKSAGKLSTNLFFLYKISGLFDFGSMQVERWWSDAAFLTLDRIIEDRIIEQKSTPEKQYRFFLAQNGFNELSGKFSLEKDLALGHLTFLYAECGGRDRFSDDFVRERTSIKLSEMEQHIYNDPRPQGAVHPTNSRILKVIPRACAMLARYSAGFDILDADELNEFEPELYAKEKARDALKRIKERGPITDLSVEELIRMTRK